MLSKAFWGRKTKYTHFTRTKMKIKFCNEKNEKKILNYIDGKNI